MSTNPYSTYDCLSLVFKLEKVLGDVAEEELQMFSYLSCLLSLYDGKSLAFWNYSFIKTTLGAPFSSTLMEAVKYLLDIGSLNSEGGYLRITDFGKSQLEILMDLDLNLNREKYLDAAVKCIEYSPYSVVKEALFKEPILHDSFGLDSRKTLIDKEDFSLGQLYDQFNHLHNALQGKYSDHLVVPAMTWLSFLINHQIG
ncbi:MAG: hypothetical protein Mars2KO_44180 [Maribacter sp.]